MSLTRSFARVLAQSHACPVVCSRCVSCSRRLSTSALAPAVQRFTRELVKHQPCYAISASSVNIVTEPRQFYLCLLDLIRRARRRLFISSLYIGSEDLELIETLEASLHAQPSLHVYMHLDYNRCTRPERLSTANLLLPLLQRYPDRVHVWFFRSPKLKGLMAKVMPPRFNEGWGGTWHPKIYGADDDLVISGANLNTSYFTNRQDRYVQLTGQPELADYCFSFLEQTASFSYSLRPSSTDKMLTNLHPHQFEPTAQTVLKTFQERQRNRVSNKIASLLSGSSESQNHEDVLVIPIIQAGQFNVREEERCLAMLFQHLAEPASLSSHYEGPLVDLTSGYFGLYKPYQNLVINSPVACRVLAASPKANGFYGSRGVSGRIPEGYTVLERRFMTAVRAAGRAWPSEQPVQDRIESGVQLSEWAREGWTYHAKGIWLRPTPSAHPCLTLFGSTNLNARSANIDTELSFMLVTTSPKLRARLAEEVDGLRSHAYPWMGAERRVRPFSWLLANALSSRL
ncbi:uncharacterized protein B0H18DRAFT_1083838 [Fomitopsis serialis]|uniref:uncharacterized protein n=1 Tax=Fomitopsis serialis TaxID=139415 RepID=UPI002007BE7E|nr:uncharacterized protein B0H18DRAFT_1083838 [Neoantrodia serialis]KAH9930781.1 hypothetical protein B0H18DRAFT_1083838 [Neoantrodia serialis]